MKFQNLPPLATNVAPPPPKKSKIPSYGPDYVKYMIIGMGVITEMYE